MLAGRAVRKPKATGWADDKTESPGAMLAAKWPPSARWIRSAVVTTKEPWTSSVAPAPNMTPAGFIRKRLALEISQRSAPSMCDADPPVTRASTLWIAPGPLNVTDPSAGTLNSSNEWNRFAPRTWPSVCATITFAPVKDCLAPSVPSVLTCPEAGRAARRKKIAHRPH